MDVDTVTQLVGNAWFSDRLLRRVVLVSGERERRAQGRNGRTSEKRRREHNRY